MTKTIRQSCFPGALTLVLGTVAVQAQESATVLEEITVTAQRTTTDLQSTPVSITAFSSEHLQKIGAFRAADVAEYTPNLNIIGNTVSNTGMAISMRGISSADAALGADSKIGMYVDGVYLARIAGSSFDIADIEQIEVLRGPQGTLWGKNTTGGSVNISTKKPTGEFGVRQLVSVGNYDYVRTNTQLNLPAWHNLAVKLAFDRSEKTGDTRNTNPVAITDLGDMSNRAWSASVRWRPTDNFTADYTYDEHDRKGTGPAFQLTAVNPQLASFENASLVTPTGLVKITNPFWQAAQQASPNRRSGFAVDPLEESNDLEGHALHLTLEAGNHIFKSITARRTYDGNKPGDFDGGTYSAPLFVAENRESQEQFSQELQITSDFQDSRWRYVAGLYYFEEETSVNNPQTFTVRIGQDPSGDPLLLTLTNTLLYTTDNNASAIYGQVAYRPPVLDDRLELSIGLRYTEDEKQASLLSRSASGKRDWNSTNPSLIVNYQMSDDINLYANISTGYNSGQFNLRATSADIFADPVDEEEVVNYELGIKSEWLSRRLRLNASLFQMDYTDLQVNQFRASESGASSIVTNAGEATITGFEIETLYLLGEHVTLNANWGYTDFEYDEFITSFNVDTGESVDEADLAQPVLAPENTGSAGLAYNRHLDGIGTFDARLDVTHTSGYDFNPFLTAYTRASSRTLLNARVSLGEVALLGDRSNLQFSLWAKNLTDKKYRFNGIDFGVDSGALGFAGVTFGPRRTFGMDVIYEFE